MSIRFDQTGRGARFFDAHVPRALELLERLVAELARLNTNLERGGDALPRVPERKPRLRCSGCGAAIAAAQAHRHQGEWVGECCWDERLRTTE